MGSIRVRWILAALTAVLLIIPFSPATAQPAPACSIGGFVSGLHDIDSVARTFKAEAWLWSVCPAQALEPLKGLDFINGVEVKTGQDAQAQRGAVWWSTRKVTGTFREDFELDSFPFDRHPLAIEMELDQQAVRLVADPAHTALRPGLSVPGWRLKDAMIRIADVAYPTAFGDPAATTSTTHRTAVDLVVHAERAHLAIFVKLTIALYIAAFLVLISLLFDVGDTDLFIGRIGLHASALFAVVLNWLAAGQTIGHHESLSLLDEIHVVTLVLVLATSVWSVFAYRAVVAGVKEDRVRRWDGRSAAIFLAAFVLANAAIFAGAIAEGSREPSLAVSADAPRG